MYHEYCWWSKWCRQRQSCPHQTSQLETSHIRPNTCPFLMALLIWSCSCMQTWKPLHKYTGASIYLLPWYCYISCAAWPTACSWPVCSCFRLMPSHFYNYIIFRVSNSSFSSKNLSKNFSFYNSYIHTYLAEKNPISHTAVSSRGHRPGWLCSVLWQSKEVSSIWAGYQIVSGSGLSVSHIFSDCVVFMSCLLRTVCCWLG